MPQGLLRGAGGADGGGPQGLPSTAGFSVVGWVAGTDVVGAVELGVTAVGELGVLGVPPHAPRTAARTTPLVSFILIVLPIASS